MIIGVGLLGRLCCLQPVDAITSTATTTPPERAEGLPPSPLLGRLQQARPLVVTAESCGDLRPAEHDRAQREPSSSAGLHAWRPHASMRTRTRGNARPAR